MTDDNVDPCRDVPACTCKPSLVEQVTERDV